MNICNRCERLIRERSSRGTLSDPAAIPACLGDMVIPDDINSIQARIVPVVFRKNSPTTRRSEWCVWQCNICWISVECKLFQWSVGSTRQKFLFSLCQFYYHSEFWIATHSKIEKVIQTSKNQDVFFFNLAQNFQTPWLETISHHWTVDVVAVTDIFSLSQLFSKRWKSANGTNIISGHPLFAAEKTSPGAERLCSA